VTQTTPEPTHQGDAKLKQSIRDRPGIHNIRGYNEKRYSEQEKSIEKALHHSFPGDG
jgi:hypothetical protein